MCFGKKEKPQPSASPQEESGPRRAHSSPPASQPRTPSQRRPDKPRPSGPPPANQPQEPSPLSTSNSQAPSPPPISEPRASSPPPASQPQAPSPPPISEPRASSPPPTNQPQTRSPPPANQPRTPSQRRPRKPRPSSPPPANQPQEPSPPPISEPQASSPPPASQPQEPSPPPTSKPQAPGPPPTGQSRTPSQRRPRKPRPSSPPPANQPQDRGPPPTSKPQAPSPPPTSLLEHSQSRTPSQRRPRKPRPSSLPPANQPQESSLPQMPRNLQGSHDPITQGQNYKDTLTTSPLGTAGNSPQPSQEPGHQDGAALQEAVFDTEIVVAVMGVTGAGKSYFIREVSGNSEVKVSSGLFSCTSKVQPYSFEYEGRKITLVDTPGFDDTQRSDTEILHEITAWTTATYRQGQLLSGIIYLHPITHTRMEGSAMRNLRMFQNLCGQEALSNVFLTTTQWSKVDLTEGQARENNLRDEGLWGGLIGKGATLQRFHGTRESGLELICGLMRNRPERLEIQDQIVEKKMTLAETGAGQYISKELVDLVEKFEAELESITKRYQEAIEAKDREMEEALTTEREETRKKLARAADEKEILAKLHEEEVKRREEKEKERLKEIRKLKKNESGEEVIAIATRDIAVTAHFRNSFTSYTTRGRLIYDINNHKEFKSDTFELVISHELNFPIDTKTIREILETGAGTNYISLDGNRYRCRSGPPTTRGGQAFFIFSRG